MSDEGIAKWCSHTARELKCSGLEDEGSREGNTTRKIHRSNGCCRSPSFLVGSVAGGDWLIRGEDEVDKAVVDRSADESTNESRSNKFFSCGYIARRETKASKAIWSLLNSATIYLMLDQTFIHLWITSQKGFSCQISTLALSLKPAHWETVISSLSRCVGSRRLSERERPLLSFIHTLACPSVDW